MPMPVSMTSTRSITLARFSAASTLGCCCGSGDSLDAPPPP
jgi:hypothetical protein